MPDELRDNWERVVGTTDTCLEPAVAGDRIGLFLQDTPHTEDNQRSEFGVALRNADSTIVLVDSSGGYCPVLQQLADHYELERHEFTPVPVDHPVGRQRRAFLVAHPEDLDRPLPWGAPVA